MTSNLNIEHFATKIPTNQHCFSSLNRPVASREQIQQLTKSELHLHLGGAWPLTFLERTASKEQYAALQEFKQKAKEGIDYHTIFHAFGLIGRIVDTDEKAREGATALCQALAADNVTYAEVRTSLKDFGSGHEHHLASILEGLRKGDVQYGTTTPLVLSLRRNTSATKAIETVQLALKYRDRGICGIDISGDSTIGDSRNLLPAIKLAQDNKLPILLHLGEAKEETSEQQLWELEHFRPARIGHGVLLHQAPLCHVIQNRIPIEICLRSSELASMIDNAESHPGIQRLREGHPVCICTDDPSVFDISLSDELYRLVQHLSMDIKGVQDLLESQEAMKLWKGSIEEHRHTIK